MLFPRAPPLILLPLADVNLTSDLLFTWSGCPRICCRTRDLPARFKLRRHSFFVAGVGRRSPAWVGCFAKRKISLWNTDNNMEQRQQSHDNLVDKMILLWIDVLGNRNRVSVQGCTALHPTIIELDNVPTSQGTFPISWHPRLVGEREEHLQSLMLRMHRACSTLHSWVLNWNLDSCIRHADHPMSCACTLLSISGLKV